VASLAPAAALAAPAHAASDEWTGSTSANGWPIEPKRISVYRIVGSSASVALRQGHPATVLLHVARRWHYEIAPLDTGEGGGVTGYATDWTVGCDFESNYLSGTALALHPTAYPLGGSERPWPHQEEVIRDILLDCPGVVAWGGDLAPAKASHFHIAVGPSDRALARVAASLDTSQHRRRRAQTPGATADPAIPERRGRAATVTRPR
jgi:hypothetical protein